MHPADILRSLLTLLRWLLYLIRILAVINAFFHLTELNAEFTGKALGGLIYELVIVIGLTWALSKDRIERMGPRI